MPSFILEASHKISPRGRSHKPRLVLGVECFFCYRLGLKRKTPTLGCSASRRPSLRRCAAQDLALVLQQAKSAQAALEAAAAAERAELAASLRSKSNRKRSSIEEAGAVTRAAGKVTNETSTLSSFDGN